MKKSIIVFGIGMFFVTFDCFGVDAVEELKTALTNYRNGRDEATKSNIIMVRHFIRTAGDNLERAADQMIEEANQMLEEVNRMRKREADLKLELNNLYSVIRMTIGSK
jgi:hypothetical protein